MLRAIKYIMSTKRDVLGAGIMVFRVMAGNSIEYLLLQASNLNHHWTPPKGHVDPGETDIIAAIRETEEEAGLKPADYNIIPDFTATLQYTAWNKNKRVVYWTAKVKDPEVPIKLSDEHMNFRWCDLPTVHKISTRENMNKSYDDLEAFLKNKFAKESSYD